MGGYLLILQISDFRRGWVFFFKSFIPSLSLSGCVWEAGGHDLRQDVGVAGRWPGPGCQGHQAHRLSPAGRRQLQLLARSALLVQVTGWMNVVGCGRHSGILFCLTYLSISPPPISLSLYLYLSCLSLFLNCLNIGVFFIWILVQTERPRCRASKPWSTNRATCWFDKLLSIYDLLNSFLKRYRPKNGKTWLCELTITLNHWSPTFRQHLFTILCNRGMISRSLFMDTCYISIPPGPV